MKSDKKESPTFESIRFQEHGLMDYSIEETKRVDKNFENYDASFY